MMEAAHSFPRNALFIALLIAGGAAGCAPEPTDTHRLGTIVVEVPVGTRVIQKNETELIAHVGKSEYRIAQEDSKWFLWKNGFKITEFGGKGKFILKEGGYHLIPR